MNYELNKAKYGTHCLIAAEIGIKKIVLDIGCNKGYLKTLAQDNFFYGIDVSDASLREAKSVGYVEVFNINLNECESFRCDLKFDVIILADILEHLTAPDKVLKYFVNNYLKKNGIAIISLPNVAHLFIRVGLLFGNFHYTDSGILDRTHFHLYTTKTAKCLIEGAGLGIIKNKFSSNNFGQLLEIFPFLGTLLGFNLVYICKKY